MQREAVLMKLFTNDAIKNSELFRDKNLCNNFRKYDSGTPDW